MGLSTRLPMILFAFVVALMPSTHLNADVPDMMNFQGVLSDSTGMPITAPTSVAFTIYNDSLAGDSLWSEQQVIVPDTRGRFDVLLGGVVSLPTSLFDGPNRWLVMHIEGGPESAPRVRLVSGPYSFKAARADRATVAYGVTDGPGISWTTNPNSVQLPWGPGTVIATVSVEAPAAGYILVTATCDISVSFGGPGMLQTREYRAEAWITETGGDVGIPCVAGLAYSSSEPVAGDSITGTTLNTPLTVQRVFTKDSAGTYYFSFAGTRLGEYCDAYAHRTTMSAVYFPTAYQPED